MYRVAWAVLGVAMLPAVAWAADGADLWGPLTLLPPLAAVGLALATRKVEASLLTGAALGALVAQRGDPVASALALLRYVGAALGVARGSDGWSLSPDHLYITVFSLLVAAMVGIVGRAGGTRALVERAERLAKDTRGAGVAAWLAGLIVFFDDYANCLVVGNAMGPLADRFGVSRAKLAYIVDSTAAPVASLAIVSTWVGYEIGLIDEGLASSGVQGSGLSVFIDSLPYRFYSVYTLAFVGVMAFTLRDFGPMRAEELEARGRVARGEVGATDEDPLGSPWTAAVPVGALVLVTLVALFAQGSLALGDAAGDAALFEILGASNPYTAMLWGSGVGFGLAVVLSLRTMAPRGVWRAGATGARSVVQALVVLYLAWTLGGAIADTGAADYLTGLMGASLSPAWLPAVTFLLASGISFATGTSFGTMGILFPIALPLAVGMVGAADDPIVLGTVGAILSGACFGDHASPISDTTVLSALGSGVDVLTHVRTQLPYAVTTGAVSLLLGYLPVGFGISPWWLTALGLGACLAIPWVFARPIPPVSSPAARTPRA